MLIIYIPDLIMVINVLLEFSNIIMLKKTATNSFQVTTTKWMLCKFYFIRDKDERRIITIVLF